MGLADLPLDVAASVTLDATGAGTVRLQPSNVNQTWHVVQASVLVSSNTKEPTAKLYQNGSSFLGGTYTGSNDSTSLDITVRNGYIQCNWTGGDAGAKATLYLQGSIHIGG